MPSRWESSNRPLFVRTVWVNGLRHAILSTDDPLLQFKYRSTPSSLPASETSSVISGNYRLEECLVKLRLALNPTEKEESIHGCQNYDKLPALTKFYYTETPELPSLPEDNPLSERVLQWLDLSGRLPEPEVEVKREKRKPERKVYAHRKELPTRSASVDIPCAKATKKKEKKTEDLPARPPSPIPPIVQSFEPTRQRPTSAWPSPPNRPQLHIFMPPLEAESDPPVQHLQDGSDCESCASDVA